MAFLSFDFHTTAGLDTSDAIAVEVSRGDPGCASCLPSDAMYSLLESVEGFSGATQVYWPLANTGLTAITLNELEVAWPAANGELKRVTLGKRKLANDKQPPATALIAGAWHDDAERREIAPFSSEVLLLEFDEDAGRSEKLYRLEVAFENDETVAFTPSNAACRIAPEQEVTFDDSNVLWTITSADEDVMTIDQFDLSWPSINGALKKIRLDGNEIFNIEQNGPTAVIRDDWKVKMPGREIAPGASAQFLLEFDDEATSTSGCRGNDLL